MTNLPVLDENTPDANEEQWDTAVNYSKANAVASKMVYVESELRCVRVGLGLGLGVF